MRPESTICLYHSDTQHRRTLCLNYHRILTRTAGEKHFEKILDRHTDRTTDRHVGLHKGKLAGCVCSGELAGWISLLPWQPFIPHWRHWCDISDRCRRCWQWMSTVWYPCRQCRSFWWWVPPSTVHQPSGTRQCGRTVSIRDFGLDIDEGVDCNVEDLRLSSVETSESQWWSQERHPVIILLKKCPPV